MLTAQWVELSSEELTHVCLYLYEFFLDVLTTAVSVILSFTYCLYGRC